MKKTFWGWLFNRIEALGNKKYNHIGCEGENEEFVEFLSQFVPQVGMRRKVKFTIETQEKPEIVKEYQELFNKNEGKKD